MNNELSKHVKSLIEHIFQNKIYNLSAKEKKVASLLKKANTMCFVNKKELDLSIQKMYEKFQFHGFFFEANCLLKVYNKYIKKIPEQDQMTGLNIVRFLLYMSDSPTTKFLENPDEYKMILEEEEEIMDWGEYLLKDIELYQPEAIEDSSDDSDLFESTSHSQDELSHEIKFGIAITPSCYSRFTLDSHRQELLSIVQHAWYDKKRFLEKPKSKQEEANIGISWEEYWEENTYGLLNLRNSSFISEYKVVREIIWQLFGTHNSFVFHFKGNKLKTRINVSVPSVRSVSFEGYMHHFVEYMELMEYFRSYIRSVEKKNVCQTYRCYGLSIKRNIMNPIHNKLLELETNVRKQNETFTLIQLSKCLLEILSPLKLLNEIHHKVVVPVGANSTLYCATSLICNLHHAIGKSITKFENDLKLTLYIESLFKYFIVIDSLLTRNDFVDEYGEFVLVKINSTKTLEYRTSPYLSAKISYEFSDDVEPEFCNDGFIKVIHTKVLQIVKNIRLLFLLRRFEFYMKHEDHLYVEFIKRFLKKLCKFFNYTEKDVFENLSDLHEFPELSYTVVNVRSQQTITLIDKLENAVDTKNHFLMDAFSTFFTEQSYIEKPKIFTLYDRIKKITTGLFPLRNCIETIFLEILKERFSVSGLMVKGILREEHNLDQLFEFLRSLFLCCDASIVPFLNQLFEEVGISFPPPKQSEIFLFSEYHKVMPYLSNNAWKYMKLSANLKSLLEDTYPLVYCKCEVNLESKREQCSDPLDICNNLNIDVDIMWPLNIVVGELEIQYYNKLFQFFVKLKWAFHTLNNLSSKRMFEINRHEASARVKNTIKKLEIFKFNLLHSLNFIQHYVLCFSLMKCVKKFDLDFERSCDLDSVIKSHCDFLEEIVKMVMLLADERDENNFNSILRCVRLLHSMWHHIDFALDDDVFKALHNSYRKCDRNLKAKINEIYFMYS